MKTRAITYGAMMTAIAVVLALLCNYFPLFWIFYYLMPVPMIILAKQQGILTAVLSSIAATLILFMLMDPFQAISFGLLLIVLGCGLGVAYYKKQSGFVKVCVGYLATAISITLIILLTQVFLKQNFITLLTNAINSTATQIKAIYTSMNLEEEQLSLLVTTVDQVVEIMKLLIPTVFLVLPFVISIVNVAVTDKILKRMRIQNKPIKNIAHWQVSRSFRAFMTVVVIATALLDFLPDIPELYNVTLTLLSSIVFYLLGISYIFWGINQRMKKHNSNVFVKIVVVFISILISYISMIIAMIGMIDVFFNLRRFHKRKDQQ